MSDQAHAPTSRAKPPPPGEEEASAVLRLGEFDDVDTLTLSEASLVINALMAKRRKDRKDRNETDVLNKTLEYLDAFARFKQKENVEAVERLLSAHKELTKFERAQIGRFLFAGSVGRSVGGRGLMFCWVVCCRVTVLRQRGRVQDADPVADGQDWRRGPAGAAG
jgi:DNA-directed RNA polymerase II subunit RPB4